MFRTWIVLSLEILALMNFVTAKRDIEAEKNPQFWKDLAKEELKVAIQTQILNTNVAKNVIIFLGDGMGISTITAGRILKGQMRGESGEETKLEMDKFPHAGLSRTYSANKQVSDSAATATAYLCGVKTNYHVVGVNSATTLGNCQSSKGNEVDSVLTDFHKAGKATGFVTTTTINHATPSATYAHSANRKWYCDADLTEEAKQNGCKDIAEQFYDASHKITVALGGGRRYFQPTTSNDPEYPDKTSKRTDGKDLISMWKTKMGGLGQTHEYVWNKRQLENVDVQRTDRLLGMFEPSHMQYEAERNKTEEPSLADMTKKAIELLRKNDEGYFLLVEGGRIDHGHHGSNAYLSLHDVVSFDNAIETAVGMTSEDDTTIIVTADHSHVFTLGGYADRGNNIFGLAPGKDNAEIALDKKPYTSLLYANGPGYHGYHYVNPANGYTSPDLRNKTERQNLTDVDTTAHGYLQQSAIPLGSESHGGEDVAILARGPMAHLFHGVHEQMYIAYVMRYVACIGPDQGHCSGNSEVRTINYIGGDVTKERAEQTLRIQFIFLILLSCLLAIVSIALYLQLRRRPKKGGKPRRDGDSDVPLNTAA